MDSGRVVYMNGKFVPESEAKISIFDSALMFGDMIFEMTRSFNKKQFMLREHLERLYTGVKLVHIPLTMTIDELEQACYETIKRNDKVFDSHDEHRLMINISRGPLGVYAPVFDGKLECTVVIADFPLKWTIASMAPLFDQGINAVIPSQRNIPANLMDPKIKNRSRLFYQMANIEASQMKGKNNWPLLLDPDGFVTEGTGCNFFIIKDGQILTPEGRNLLRGISREYIFTLAEELNIHCRECNIEPYDVYTADEAFMTGTPFCMLPIFTLQGLKIGEGKMGTITSSLLDKWSNNVGLDIQTQIIEYGKEVDSLNSNSPTPYQFKK